MEPVCFLDGRVKLYLGDCLGILPTLPEADICVTDPPYGCGKADWDTAFPTQWYGAVRAESIVTITGSAGLPDAISLVGGEFIDVIAARNLNGMTRGPIGFGNWLSAVVSRGKPRQGINAFDFSVTGEMPDHPSPKPLEYMLKLIERVTDRGDCVLDPFMGSGTTGVACVKLGRRFFGVEIDPAHFATACKRIEQATKQADLFIETPPAPKQEALAI